LHNTHALRFGAALLFQLISAIELAVPDQILIDHLNQGGYMKQIPLFGLFTVALMSSATAFAAQVPGPLVEAQWLAQNKDSVTILEVRADTKSFIGKPVFEKDPHSGKDKLAKVGGHIPGSVLVDYKQVREDRMVNGQKVKFLIPEKPVFEKLMQSSGLNKDSTVIIVTKGENNHDMTMATRLYWELKYFGQDNMAILNGGLAQWITDGHKISSEPSKPATGNWVATAERKELLATSEDVANAIKDGKTQLVDTRSMSQYMGMWKKPTLKTAGHIPGAKVFPNELLTGPSAPNKFFPVNEMTKLTTELGLKSAGNTITYCNTGHLASGSWFVMHELMGNKNVKVYDGSMHEWTLEKRPVVAMKVE
jgi:thiosulfate/3-mercaptopyruvate sulfurtransferase